MTTLFQPGPLVGVSTAIRRAMELVDRFGPTTVPVLLVGPTGTGKDLLAQHIHARSQRVGSFVPVNCGALPREMVESLLFGHRRGAFSSAVESRRGHLECANGGTLFLDELLSLPAEGQAKLLRALDSGEIQPLGEEHPRFVDTRVVAAVQEFVHGTLRCDLYQRLAGVVITIPPLAERPEDVLPLAQHFASFQGRVLAGGVEAVLLRHTWAGNVRELRLVIERAGRLVENSTLSAGAVAEAIVLGTPSGPNAAWGETRRDPLRDKLLAVGTPAGWDPTLMAQALGIRRSAFYERLRAAGLSLRALRKSGKSGGRPVDKPDDTHLPSPMEALTR